MSALTTHGFGAALAILLSLAAPLAGCGGGKYIWIDELPQQKGSAEYVIAAGDTLSVKVFNQDNMSTRARVRSDGKIAIPMLGDVDAVGKTPNAFSKELAGRFKEYVVTPVVTTTVEATQTTSVSVLGEVSRPGIFQLEGTTGVLSALAAAGGLTEYASRDGIYVVRPASSQKIRFTFSALAQGEGAAANFHLRAGDVVVVE